ncbi:MAG: dihydroneopterin aldolase [Flavobacteriales bacterium]|nr:dihydroneopterin aldolase [Flavobacteriales bacterium]
MHAKHGCHAEERRTGGPFSVDVCVYGDFSPATLSDDIQDAVDYVGLMDLVTEIMAIPKNLIETVAADLAGAILERFQTVRKVDITIRKMKPPVKHDVDFVSCRTSLERAQN